MRRTPLHMPETLEACKKKAHLVWLKELPRVQQIACLKQQSFLSFPFYQAQRSYKKIMCICSLFYCFSVENGIIRSSHPRHSMKEGVLKNFVKFTGKHLCQSVFLINLQALLTSFLIVLTCKICHFSFWYKIILCFNPLSPGVIIILP